MTYCLMMMMIICMREKMKNDLISDYMSVTREDLEKCITSVFEHDDFDMNSDKGGEVDALRVKLVSALYKLVTTGEVRSEKPAIDTKTSKPVTQMKLVPKLKPTEPTETKPTETKPAEAPPTEIKPTEAPVIKKKITGLKIKKKV